MSLQKQIVREGSGPVVTPGSTVTVNYVGTLLDGTKFDSSYDRNQPFSFSLKRGVIEGWLIGVASMKKGEVCILTIPPHLAYGSQGVGNVIPPNATLIFQIELLGWN